MIGVVSGGESAWQDGEPLPHLSFDDPPVDMTEESYRELLIGAARESESQGEFTIALMCALGRDLIVSHGVSPAVALPAVTAFAVLLYADYHETPEPPFVTV